MSLLLFFRENMVGAKSNRVFCAPLSPFLRLAVLLFSQNAISVELKNPKDLITSTFASREIEIVQHTAFTVAILMLISCLVIVARYLWKTYANNNNRVSHRQTEQDAPLLQQN